MIITGATGFIGRALLHSLQKEDYRLTVCTRNPESARKILGKSPEILHFSAANMERIVESMEKSKAIINLAGENIARKRWTRRQKDRILSSRVESIRLLITAMQQATSRPDTFIQASAIGYYPDSRSETFKEDSRGGDGFLSSVIKSLESELVPLQELGIRTVILRSGLVLGATGGLLKRMLGPFKWYLGGQIGSRDQWMSWIHIEDEIRAIRYLLGHPRADGIFNLTTPNPVPSREFYRSMGRSLHRPVWTRLPDFMVKIIFGQMGKEMVLSSQRVIPDRLLKLGFNYKFNQCGKALDHLLGEEKHGKD